MGLTTEQIHEDADKYEHLLTDEILDEVDRTLGYPTTDPHGSPIPARRGLPEFSLLQLMPNEQASIAAKQPGEHVTGRLWQLGLLPEIVFSVQKKEGDHIAVEQSGKLIQVPNDLARRVKIVTVDGKRLTVDG
jgi:hypothetical protein